MRTLLMPVVAFGLALLVPQDPSTVPPPLQMTVTLDGTEHTVEWAATLALLAKTLQVQGG